MSAEVAFDFEHDAGEFAFRIIGSIGEELPHRRKDQSLRLAGTDSSDHGDAGIETTFRQGQPMRNPRRRRL